MLLSECAVCDSKKSNFIKQEETSGLSSSLEIKTSLSKVPLAGTISFFFDSIKQVITMYKINKTVNKILLAGDKFMPEMHLRLDLYIVLVDHLRKTKNEYNNLKKQGIHHIFIKTN